MLLAFRYWPLGQDFAGPQRPGVPVPNVLVGQRGTHVALLPMERMKWDVLEHAKQGFVAVHVLQPVPHAVQRLVPVFA